MTRGPYNYSKLLGRLREKGITQEELARKIGLNPSTLNIKLKSKSDFSQTEIRMICEVLDIPLEEIPAYFFVR